jgi:Na+/melibiose symporter-like transporter
MRKLDERKPVILPLIGSIVYIFGGIVFILMGWPHGHLWLIWLTGGIAGVLAGIINILVLVLKK